MREPTFLVLTALAGGPLHGYAVLEDVARMTGGRARVGPGTLYATLDRLRGEGLVEVSHEEVVQSRLRRYYVLTGEGQQRLSEEVVKLRAQAAVAEKRLRRLKGLTA